MDIRGFFVDKGRESFKVKLPAKMTFDSKEKKKVQYPVLQFANREKTMELLEIVRAKAKAYIEENWGQIAEVKIPKKKPFKSFKKKPFKKETDKKPLWNMKKKTISY